MLRYSLERFSLCVFAVLTIGSYGVILQENLPETDRPISPSGGLVDTSFNPAVGFPGRIFNAALQADGSVIVVGQFGIVNGTQRLNVARLLSDGTLDPTFNPPIFSNGVSQILAIQPDGKILIFSNNLFRLNIDGSVDSSFNSGVAGSLINCIWVLEDGDILLGGGEFPSQNGDTRLIRLNSDGSVDNGFAAQIGVSGNAVRSLAVTPDNRLLVGGNFTTVAGQTRYGLAKLEMNGGLVTSFNTGITSGNVSAVLALDNGQIALVGSVSLSGNTFRLLRLNADGSRDTSFIPDSRFNGTLDGLASLHDGRIIVYGSFNESNGQVRRVRIVLADGAIDETFNVSVPVNSSNFSKVIVQDDGKLLLTGNYLSINGSIRSSISRMDLLGVVDPAFAPYLVARTQVSGNDVSDLLFLPAGRILVCGSFRQVGRLPRSSIAQINADGSLDEGFNQSDVFSSMGQFPIAISQCALQPDGKILAVGNFTSVGGFARNGVVRLNQDGSVDPSFDMGPQGPSAEAYSIAVQSDGKIILGGAFTFVNGTPRRRVARLHPNGTLDATFDSGNLLDNGVANELAVLPDGKVLVLGVYDSTDPTWRTLVRLNSNGTRDATFSSLIWSVFLLDMEIRSDGKILIGGSFSSANGQARKGIVRLNPNGSTDNGFAADIPEDRVQSVSTVDSGQTYVGGTFVAVQTVPRNGAVAFNELGLLEPSTFDGFAHNGVVNKIYGRPDGSVIIQGTMTTVNGNARMGFARILPGPSPTPTSTPTNTPTATPTATPAGIEGDIAPRPNGDGTMASADVVQARRFVAGLDTVNGATNEFQRADSAPRGTFGDGSLSSADVVQARRYVAGLDPLTNAGGPTVAVDRGLPAVIGGTLFGKNIGAFSLLRLRPGKNGAMVVVLESGTEVSAVSFGLRYDPALGRPLVLAGELPEGAVLTVNDTVAGELTVLIDSDRPLGKTVRLVSIGFEKNATDRSIEFDGAASLSDVLGNAVAVLAERVIIATRKNHPVSP